MHNKCSMADHTAFVMIFFQPFFHADSKTNKTLTSQGGQFFGNPDCCKTRLFKNIPIQPGYIVEIRIKRIALKYRRNVIQFINPLIILEAQLNQIIDSTTDFYQKQTINRKLSNNMVMERFFRKEKKVAIIYTSFNYIGLFHTGSIIYKTVSVDVINTLIFYAPRTHMRVSLIN